MTRKQRLKEIGTRLTKLREQLNYSRTEMACHCELTESGFAKNKRGDHLPKLDTLENLVKKFDASMDWLLFNKCPLFYKEKTPEEKNNPRKKNPQYSKNSRKNKQEKNSPDWNKS